MLELGYCAYTCLAPLKGLGRKGGSITKKHVLYIYIYDICSMSMYMYIYIYMLMHLALRQTHETTWRMV